MGSTGCDFCLMQAIIDYGNDIKSQVIEDDEGDRLVVFKVGDDVFNTGYRICPYCGDQLNNGDGFMMDQEVVE